MMLKKEKLTTWSEMCRVFVIKRHIENIKLSLFYIDTYFKIYISIYNLASFCVSMMKFSITIII